MNSNRETEKGKELLEDLEAEDLRSVDDFFKELEAKEKDLHISSDLVIEIEDSDFDDQNSPDFPIADLSPANVNSVEPVYSARNHSPDTGRFETEIAELKGRISKMEAERVEIYENSQRRNRDFENYKNRTERDRQENLLNQVSNLATELLPVLDNLDRALECATRISDPKQKDFKQFFDGIVLVNQQLNEVLAEMGVQPISSVGEHFDPHLHEAVAMEETDEFPPNVITSELLRGYRIGDKIVRASMVKVSASRASAKPVAAAEPLDVSEETVNDQVETPFHGPELES
jgi:molecular chaperone GrpE